MATIRSTAARSSPMVDALLGRHARAQSSLEGARANRNSNVASTLLNIGTALVAKHRMRGVEEALAEREAALRGATGDALGAYLGEGGGDHAALIQALTGAGHGGADALALAGAAKGLLPEPAAPMMEDVSNPYGFGGHYQRDPATGKLTHVAGPREAPKPVKGTELSRNVEYLIRVGAAEDPSDALAKLGKGGAPGVVGEYTAAVELGLFQGSLEDYVHAKRAQTSIQIDQRKPPPGYAWVPGEERLVPIPGGPAEKIGEAQMRAAQAAQEIESSLQVLESAGDDGRPLFEQGLNPIDTLNPTAFGKGADRERFEQAMSSAAEMILRMETGAAATQPEIDRVIKRYSPRPGDEPETIAQKLNALRERAVQAAKLSGPAYEPLFGAQADAPAPTPAPAPGGTHAAAAGRGGAPTIAVPPPSAAAPRGASVATPPAPALSEDVDLETLDAGQLEQWLDRFGIQSAGASAPTGMETPAPGFTWEQPPAATPAPAPARAAPAWSPLPAPATTAAVPSGEVGPMTRTRLQDTGRAGGPLGAPGTGADLVRRAEGTARDAGGPQGGPDWFRRGAGASPAPRAGGPAGGVTSPRWHRPRAGRRRRARGWRCARW